MPEGPERVPVPVELAGPERAVLLALREAPGPVSEEALPGPLRLTPEAVRGTLQRLRAKHLAVSAEEHLAEPRLTPRGEASLRDGLPERRVVEALSRAGRPLEPAALEATGLSEEERSAAIGALRRRGLVRSGMPLSLTGAVPGEGALPEEVVLEEVRGHRTISDPSLLARLVRRGLVEIERHTRRRWSPSEEGRQLTIAEAADSLGALTPELLAEGRWRSAPIRAYDVRAPVPRWDGARPHPYRAWLDEFEEVLIGLGFVEAAGPLVESEFWNADALFMPQEHPARSIHDVLSVKGIRSRPPPGEILERVAAAHEGRPLPGTAEPISPGWRTTYDRSIAERPVLRSQTTAVSARFLATRPSPPFRMYSLDRNFRRDAVDATHHVEFQQCEGVLGEESTSLRDLLGVFRALAEAIGIRELKFRPSFFPFTEPSVEGYVRHPRLGWIEVFPGGLFRPEVLRPLGVDVPEAAWGIGVTRLAMVRLGLSDIRDLFLDDLGRLKAGGL